MKRYKEIRKAGAVKRYHTSETIRTQTVAEHSWHVAQIVLYIYPQARADLIKAALDHDIGELYTGDIPAPFKWDHPKLAAELKTVEANYLHNMGSGVVLSEVEQQVLDFADMLDCLLWCGEELRMGNTHVQEIYSNARRALSQRWCPSIEAKDLLESCSGSVPVL